MRSYFLHLLPNIFFEIAESVEGDGCHSGGSRLLVEPRAQILIFEGQHAAVRMVDDNKFLRC